MVQEVERALIGVLAFLESRDRVEHLEFGRALPKIRAEADLAHVLAQIAMIADEDSDLAGPLAQLRHRPAGGRADFPVVEPDIAGPRRRRQVGDDGDDGNAIGSQTLDRLGYPRMIHGDDRDRVDVSAEFEQALGSGLGREIVPMLDHRFASHRC